MLPARLVSPSRHPCLRLLNYDTPEIPVPANLTIRSVYRSAASRLLNRKRNSFVSGVALSALMLMSVVDVKAETWRGLVVAPEIRCTPYDSEDYHYPQSVELKIIESIGKIYSPYTGICFSNRRQTDIEHIVARSEAHDSGMCSADTETKSRFARDLLNLTLASPRVNRSQKKAKDAADWVPEFNQCWFAARVVAVKRKYSLTVDGREAVALENILSNCDSTRLIVGACRSAVSPTRSSKTNDSTVGVNGVLARWDDNRNGRITCKEARKHGIAPVARGHPAYRFMNDRDGDGVVCE